MRPMYTCASLNDFANKPTNICSEVAKKAIGTVTSSMPAISAGPIRKLTPSCSSGTWLIA